MKRNKNALILSGGGARGAFQVGVLKYLDQRGFKPDLICGTSAGALNAVAIASGMNSETLRGLWTEYSRRHFFQFDFFRFLLSFFSNRKYYPLMDSAPLETLILKHIDFNRLKNSATDVVVTAVDTQKGKIGYFGKRAIDSDILMASAAMPVMCSWRDISGNAWWDGGIMDNVPILPALESGAEKIIVVLLSPVGVLAQSPPRTLLKTMEMVFEQSLIGAMVTLLAQRTRCLSGPLDDCRHIPDLSNGLTLADNTKITFVCPERMLGFRSYFSFSETRARHMMAYGFKCARKQLAGSF